MKVAAVALALVPMLLAGCNGGAGGGDDPSGGTAVKGKDAGESPLIALPTWAVGDYWTYTFNGVPTTYVITGQTASDWIMETDSEERSFSDLRDDVSRLGPQRKSDLAGSQGSDRVEFFHWPMQTFMPDWTTRWDHQDVRIHLIGANPGMTELEARLTNATASDPPLYKYVYDDTVGWFSELTHYAPDGSEVVALKLTDSGHNWTGQLARWDLDVVLDVEGDLGQSPAPGTYQVPLTATDVWVHAALHCTQGVAQVGTSPAPFAGSLIGQDDRGWGASGQPCPADDDSSSSAGAPMAGPSGGPETWGYAIVGQPNSGTYRLEILVRTLTFTPFGA